MSLDDPADERRRLLLLAWLARRGAWAAALAAAPLRAQVLGNVPRRLVNESVFRVSGEATANGAPVSRATRIGPGDALRTGRDSELVFVVGSAAMLMRADTQVQLGNPQGGAPGTVVVPAGKVLAVFAAGQRSLQTPTAAVRISGTGVYLEANPEETYYCTCYGSAEVSARADPTSMERVVSKRHDKPLYIVAGNRQPGRAIRPAAFINHTDEELALIEALVGRRPPWVHGLDRYERRRPSDDYNR